MSNFDKKPLAHLITILEAHTHISIAWYGLSEVSFCNIIQALRDNETAVAQILTEFQSSHYPGFVSRFVKLNDPDLKSIDIIIDCCSADISLVIQKRSAKSFTGFYKSATEQILIKVDPKDDSLLVAPMIKIQAKNHIDNVSIESSVFGGIPYQRVSNKNGEPFHLVGEVMALEQHKGNPVSIAIAQQCQKEVYSQVEDILHCMMQVGSQLSNFHKKGGNHFDVKTDNITVQSTFTKKSKYISYTLIDYPFSISQKKIMYHDPNTTYTQRYVYQNIGTETGKSSPLLRDTGNGYFMGEKSYRDILCYIGLNKSQITEYVATAKKHDHLIFGHAIDSYGYLYVLYEHIHHNPMLEKAFRRFLSVKMQKVLAAVQDPQDTWPESLTVEAIRSSFYRHCRGIGLGLLFKRIRKKNQPSISDPTPSLLQSARDKSLQPIKLSRALRDKIVRSFHYGWLESILDIFDYFFSTNTRKASYKQLLAFFMAVFQKKYSSKMLIQSIQSIDFLLSKNTFKDPSINTYLEQIKKSIVIILKKSYPRDKKTIPFQKSLKHNKDNSLETMSQKNYLHKPRVEAANRPLLRTSLFQSQQLVDYKSKPKPKKD
ncbi:MAG: hypothetical protein VX112_03645 [Pseudomonadota bacterium]|nr:hypothetical protein [Pseudomonadota bacterium]